MSFKIRCTLLLSIYLFLISGCAALSAPDDRYDAADRVASTANFKKTYIKTASFTLTAYVRYTRQGDPLHIYIEGDGNSWATRTRLSDDPTPKTPLVLEMAALDPASNVVYLARPGQYGAQVIPDCDAVYWSEKRFAKEVVDAAHEAIDMMRKEVRAREIHLIGYSGGAAIAVLVASRRADVASLRTVAGNLDPDEVNRHHGVSPLKDSQNPMAVAGVLRGLSQRHFVGSQDAVIPRAIAQSFVKRASRQALHDITIVEGASHTRGWRERWKDLLTIPLNDQSK